VVKYAKGFKGLLWDIGK